jgi:hypothetical protein
LSFTTTLLRGSGFLEGCEKIAHQNKLRKKRRTESRILCSYHLPKEKPDQWWELFILTYEESLRGHKEGMLASDLVQ